MPAFQMIELPGVGAQIANVGLAALGYLRAKQLEREQRQYNEALKKLLGALGATGGTGGLPAQTQLPEQQVPQSSETFPQVPSSAPATGATGPGLEGVYNAFLNLKPEEALVLQKHGIDISNAIATLAQSVEQRRMLQEKEQEQKRERERVLDAIANVFQTQYGLSPEMARNYALGGLTPTRKEVKYSYHNIGNGVGIILGDDGTYEKVVFDVEKPKQPFEWKVTEGGTVLVFDPNTGTVNQVAKVPIPDKGQGKEGSEQKPPTLYQAVGFMNTARNMYDAWTKDPLTGERLPPSSVDPYFKTPDGSRILTFEEFVSKLKKDTEQIIKEFGGKAQDIPLPPSMKGEDLFQNPLTR
jgi:hypothetical protein